MATLERDMIERVIMKRKLDGKFYKDLSEIS